jgi:hypothetical protein
MSEHGSEDDATLAARITEAVKDLDSATATRNEKAVAAGRLLAEARKRHQTDKAFEKFLKQAGGVGLRRAQELIAIAVGRKDFEQRQAENAAAQKRFRDKQKAEKVKREKAAAALPKPEPKPEPKPRPEPKSDPKPKENPAVDALRNAAGARQAEMSAVNLRKFKDICRDFLPLLSKLDLEEARTFVNSGEWRPREGKAA